MFRAAVYLTGFVWVMFSSCTVSLVNKKPKNQYFFFKNHVEVKGGKFTKTEKKDIESRLKSQIEDSASSIPKDFLIFFQVYKKPAVLDTNLVRLSANNMRSYMFHVGHYHAITNYRIDTLSGRRINVYYTVQAGEPTLVSQMQYRLKKPDLQSLTESSLDKSLIQVNTPVSKASVLGEIARLVDTFRNNGYYKFTSQELKMKGDTSIAALTSVSDDPFEQMRLLAEAQRLQDSPKIKLALVLNPPADSSVLKPYYIRNIYLLTDYQPTDNFFDTTSITQRHTRRFILRQHQKNIRTGYLSRTITLRSGDRISPQANADNLNALSKSGIWRSINLQINEVPDSSGKKQADLVFEMLPNFRYTFQTSLEASYSASRNVLAGNLFGLGLNVSLLDRNFDKGAGRITHTLRTGIELNSRSRGTDSKLINSNEVSYGFSISSPKLIKPFNNWFKKSSIAETFGNANVSYITRLNLFNLQSINLNGGFSWMPTSNVKVYWKPLFAEFSYLFNQSDSFRTILDENPFLRYSYTTAFALGMAGGITSTKVTYNKTATVTRERYYKLGLEESGLTWGLLPILTKYKRNYVKLDLEYKRSWNYQKSAFVWRIFTGVGVPLLGSDTNRTLPFFKQYLGGGSNSMRGWPIRGIGPGGKMPIPYSSSKTIFNDRTGDMQFETNAEYRYNIATLIPNTLYLKGALFVDVGNIWNFRNTKFDGSVDSSQFQLKNFYSQLGVSAGTGFRFDFSNLILRFDLGFRFKRPELYYDNNGWKAPSIGFDNLLKKIFTKGADNEYRQWRYENFNFSIAVSYPF